MKKNNGFGLIEVLISVLVLAIGLLGLAGLQATSLSNNLSAYNRTQATQLSNDMADRMRANIANSQLYATSTYNTVAPSAATAQPGCITVAGCTAAQMAQHDLYQWNLAITNLIAGGQGTINVVGSIYTISIDWDDDKDGSTADLSFQMSFQL